MRHLPAGLVSVLIFSAFSSAQSLKYHAVTSFSTGSATPTYLVSGDFNGDGKPDLAVPDYYGKTISIYLNKGDGTFSAPVVTTLNITNTVGGIVVGDINEDGKQDLVVGTVAGTQYAIPLLGNGDGTFIQQPAIANSFGFLSGALADFDGDGHLDLFLGGNGEPYLFLGKGDGTFTQQSIPNGSFPGDYSSVAVGDLNGDKLLDAIGADYGDPGNQGGSVDIFPGQASGGFGPPTFFQPTTISNPLTVDVADFNHDGKLDLLLAGNGGLYVATGNGDGTFQIQANQLIMVDGTQASSPAGDSITGIHVDLNGDGYPDIAGLDSGGGFLTLILNDGTGTFPNALNSPYSFKIPINSYRIVTADFNGDGVPDFAISNSAGKSISMLLSGSVVTPIISISSSGSTALIGSDVSVQVKVSGQGTTATGNVTFFDGTTAVGTKPLDANGSATLVLSSLTTGVHSLSAKYAGDSNYGPVSSGVVNESITDFRVAATPSSQIVTAGSTATYAIAISPLAGFSGDVAISCSGLPSLAQCGSTTAHVSSGTTTVNLVVNTTATVSSNRQSVEIVSYCGLFGVFLVCFASRKRRLLLGGSAMMLVAVLGLNLSGCSGGTKAPSQPGTPTGTTSFTITASATQNGATLAHTTQATLVVQ